MSGGQRTRIEEIATVKGGKRLPEGAEFANAVTDHPYIRARDIGGNRITFDDPTYIDDHTFSKLKNYIVSEGDIIVTIVGANIGDIALVKYEFEGANLTENAAKISVDRSKCDPTFLSFQLSMPHSKEKFRLLTGGGAQGKLGLYKIKSFQILVPSLPVQQRVSQILSAYDDLIENNRRRIALLEEAARLLYREWFVHFRFPGHGHVKMADGLPTGWNRTTVGSVLELCYGKALKEENRIEGLFPVYGSSGKVGIHNKALIEGPAIVVGRKGNVGSIYWVPVDFWPIDTVYYVPRDQSNYWLYLALPTVGFQNTDGGVPGLNRDFAYSRKLILPADRLRRLFNETVEPMFAQRITLENYNLKLAQARDLLLPRLMNGEIAV